jgi:hypothetical protein
MEQPVNQTLLVILALLDMVLITLLVLVWPDAEARGTKSPYFIFYYPIILAFAFVFPPRLTTVYAVLTLAAYVAVCLVADISFIRDGEELERLVIRLITLGSMAALATYYWIILRGRRRAISDGGQGLAQ